MRKCSFILITLLACTVFSSAGADRLPDAIWGTLGSGPGQVNEPRGIAVDASGFVYVADTRNDRIDKFDSNGGFVESWGITGHGPGQFSGLNGIAVAPGGKIVVADTYNSRIQVFDSNGGFIRMFGQGGAATDSSIGLPACVAVDADGSIYVTGGVSNFVSKFTSTGMFIRRWYDQLSYPMGVAPDLAGTLYVCSAANGTVVVSDTTGVVRYSFGQIGEGVDDFSGQFGIAVRGSEVVIADTNNSRIKIHAQDGRFISLWGRFGSLPGQFSQPVAVAVGPDGAIYVADTYNHRIQKFADHPVAAGMTSWGAVKSRYRQPGAAQPTGQDRK